MYLYQSPGADVNGFEKAIILVQNPILFSRQGDGMFS